MRAFSSATRSEECKYSQLRFCTRVCKNSVSGNNISPKASTEKGLPPADAEALFEKENSEYQFFISARILSLASSTFMRERIKVMMASSTKGITRYMSFSILMQDSGCTASALS